MKSKIFFHAMGGLGNQMFQYAFAKSLAINNEAKLFVDNTSGFLADYQYKRKYELGNYDLHINKASNLEKITLFFYLTKKRFFKTNKKRINNLVLLNEINHKFFNRKIAEYRIKQNQKIWIKGYWQSEKYFKYNENQIFTDFKICKSNKRNFLKMYERIKNSNSVSIGVRMYEEVPGNDKSFVGGVQSLDFYINAISYIKSKISNPVFFIFSTKNFNFLKEIIKDENYYLITHENDYEGTMDRLWLMSKCKNHIISNSSFYWWAAWLSEFKNKNSIIIASNNFANSDTVPDRWEKL